MAETKITKSLVVGGNIATMYSTMLKKLTNLNFTKFSSTFPTEIEFRRGKSTLLAKNLLDVKTILHVSLKQVLENVHLKFDYTLSIPSSYVKKGDNEIEHEFIEIQNEMLKEADQTVKQDHICSGCKSIISPSDKFCKNCGTPILVQTEKLQDTTLTVDSQTASNIVTTKEKSPNKLLQMEPSIAEMVKPVSEQSSTQPASEQILRDRARQLKEDEEKNEFLLYTIENMRSSIIELDKFFTKLTQERTILINKASLDEFLEIKQRFNANLRIASYLLDIQKITLNNFTMIKNNYSLSEIMLTKIATLKKEAESHNVTITHEIQPMVMCYCDRSSIEHAIESLILNAIDFCHRTHGGHVNISLQRNNDIVKITIKDNGIGIRNENIERIFDKFYMIDPTLNRAHNETSPGLFVCKWIIENHEGGIWAESGGLGKGAEIHITLPLVTQSVSTLKKIE